MRYVAQLKSATGEKRHDPDHAIDADLTAVERARNLAWQAHLELNMGDLVAHMMYSLEANWVKLTHPTLAGFLPVPQKYYVPARLRDSYRARLEAVGLWNLPGIEQEPKKPFEAPVKQTKESDPKEKYLRVFERAKVEEKARSSFDVYSRLLGKNDFFYPYRPTSIDLTLAAHVLLLTKPEFPDPLLQTLIRESYPTLVNHAEHVYRFVFPTGISKLNRTSMPGYSIRSLVPISATNSSHVAKEVDPEDVRFARMRWTWIAVAVGGVAYWFWEKRGLILQAVAIAQEQQRAAEAAVDGEGDMTEEEDEEVALGLDDDT
ncbi:hypothetical protein HGRIS_012865 [Hohenbuehelia grisea]